jgi:Ser/Thr protein kinase RdoA (MazF antagonist)
VAGQKGHDDNRARRRAAVLAAGSAALGRKLAGPEPMRDSGWTVVLRCTDEAGPADSRGTVIVKAYPPGPDGETSFAAEAAGLALAGDTGLAPELLAADRRSLTVVMSDLGRAPSLADALLGIGQDRATQALLDWAEACGRLAVAVAGREPELAGLRLKYAGGGRMRGPGSGMEQRVLGVAERAALVGVIAPERLAAELAEVAAAVARPACLVFSPGDICPDNNLLTPGGVRFIDFEASGYHTVFLDAAYLRMPFSTCWCVFRLPPGLRDAAEARYRAQAARIWPELADDGIWERGVRRAVAAWSLDSMWWLLGRALTTNASLEPDAVAAPRTR